MNRRKFMGGSAAGLLAGAGLGWPRAARAQPRKLPVIGLVDGVWPHLTGQVGRGLRENGLVGGRDFPELRVRIARVNEAGVAHGDVAVDLAVDEENRDGRRSDGIFRRNFLQVEVVFPAHAQEGDFD